MKDEAYYAKRLEEVLTQTNNLSLMAKGGDKNEGTYQIWSSGSDDEEMSHPNHGVLLSKYEECEYDDKILFDKSGKDCDEELEEYAKVDGSAEEDEETTGRCFVSITPKSPMISKARDLLVSFNIPPNFYHIV